MALPPKTSRAAWLAKWDALVNNRATRPVKYLHIGDSITEGYGSDLTELKDANGDVIDHILDQSWPAREQIEFEKEWTTTGTSTYGFEFVNSHYRFGYPSALNAAPAYTGKAAYKIGDGLIGKKKEMANGSVAVFYRRATSFEVYVKFNNTTGSAKVYIDNGSTPSGQVSGKTGIQKITISGLNGSAIHRIEIRFADTATTSNPEFIGVAVYRGTENKGIQVWSGAWSGSFTAQFLGEFMGKKWAEMIDVIDPDVISISWVTNDMDYKNGNKTPAQFQANTESMIDQLRAVAPNAMIFIQLPQPYAFDQTSSINKYIGSYTYQNYVDTGYAVAANKENVFVKSISDHVAKGVNLYKDNIHPNSTGYLKYGLLSMQALRGDFESGSTGDTTAPSVPTSFRSTSKSTNTVALAWNASTDNVGVTGYRVLRDNVPVKTLGTVLTYTDTGLTANRAYNYTIEAFDAAGNYSARASVSVTTTASSDAVAPGAPTLTATVQSGTSVALSWSGSTDNVGVTNYTIFSNGALIATNGTATTYTATGLTAGTKYTFIVYAKDAAGNTSPASNSAIVTTTPTSDTTAPTTPGALVQGAVTDTTVALSWGASTDAGGMAGYRLFQDGKQLAATITGTSYTVTGLTAATAYAFVVKAYDKAGNVSAGTAALTVSTTAPDETGSDIPTNIAVSNVTQTGATVTWTAPSDGTAVSYKVFASGVLLAQNITATSYNATGLDPNTRYVFAVKSVDAGGAESQTSQGRAATTLPTTDTIPPTAPTDVTVGVTTTTTVALSWTASTDNVGVAGYKIVLDGEELDTTVTATSLTITGLTANTSYSIVIKAFDDAGNDSTGSTAVTAQTTTTTDTTRPSTPNGLAASNVTGTSVDLSWNASTDNVGVVGYIVYKDGQSIGSPTGTTYTVTGLNPSTSYGFVVKAVDAGANIGFGSAALYVTTTAVVDTEAPTAPGTITSSNVTSTSVTLTWGAATDNVGVTNYYVLRDGTRIAVLGNVLTYNATGLAASKTYGFVIQAVDGAGNVGVGSATKSVTTASNADTQRPTTPQSLAASNITMNTLTLNWTASTDNVGVTGYEVYRNGTRVTTVTTGTTYNATNLQAGTAYTYYVTALDLAGNKSNGSTQITVTTAPDTSTQPTSAPSDVRVTAATLTSISIAWTAPATQPNGLSGYVVLYDGKELPVDASTTQATITGLTDSTTYQFTVVAVSSNGIRGEESAPLNASTDQYQDTTAPTRPTSLVASQVSDTSAVLTWNASTDDVAVSSYVIYMNGDIFDQIEASYTDGDGQQVFPSTLTFANPFLEAETTYTFYVRAQDAAGNISSGSNEISVTTEAPRTGADVKVWTGANWNTAEVKVWNGTAWVVKPVKTWNGSSWL
jgi:chitodextrinase/lysophospholipase L1-like esterase